MVSILRRAWQELATALSKPINKVAAVVLSTYTFLWGFWIANPFWNVFGHAKIYDWLNQVAPESYWGCMAMAVGAIMTYGVMRGSANSLTIGAFVGFIHWLIISMGYFMGDWQNTGGVTSASMAIFCAAIYLNIRFLRYRETHQE